MLTPLSTIFALQLSAYFAFALEPPNQISVVHISVGISAIQRLNFSPLLFSTAELAANPGHYCHLFQLL